MSSIVKKLPSFTLINSLFIMLPPALILLKYILLYFVKIHLIKTGLWASLFIKSSRNEMRGILNLQVEFLQTSQIEIAC